ncbi:hypothetical protein LZ190_21125 [Rhodovulum sulfidophilum]|nr:hypothetical protein [Rhodovulum sulfidophilum]
MLKSTAISDAGITKQTLYGVEKNQFTRATYGRAIERDVRPGRGAAAGDACSAAWLEGAAGWQADRRGHGATDDRQTAGGLFDPGHVAVQLDPGVGTQRIARDLGDGYGLDLARIENGNAGAEPFNDVRAIDARIVAPSSRILTAGMIARICATVVASSAVVGVSVISSTRAATMAMRC